MTEPDRTDELVRAMLARRSGGTTPDWLLAATMYEVARSRQSRGSGPSFLQRNDAARTVILVAAIALLALASAIAAGAFLQRDGNPLDPPVALVDVTPTPRLESANAEVSDRIDDGASPSASDEPPQATPQRSSKPPKTAAPPVVDPDTDPVDEPPIGIDALALVTPEGDRLRVRSLPGLGEDSAALTPLLRAYTNAFVFEGPVSKDGFDWYQVMAYGEDLELFGWVAAGDERDMWLQTFDPDCADQARTFDVLERTPPQFLACYGDQAVTVTGRINDGLGPLSEGGTVEGVMCPEIAETSGCEVTEPWLQVPTVSILVPRDDEELVVDIALRPGDEERFFAAPPDRDVRFTIAMDAPESRECAVVDKRTGEDHLSPGEAVTRCRLHFVLRDIDW